MAILEAMNMSYTSTQYQRQYPGYETVLQFYKLLLLEKTNSTWDHSLLLVTIPCESIIISKS